MSKVTTTLEDFGMHVVLNNDNTCWFAFEHHGECVLGSYCKTKMQFKLHAVVPHGTDFYSDDLITIIYNGSEVREYTKSWFNDFIISNMQ